MLELPGFSVGEQLYESDRTLVFRGERLEDKKPVVLKLLKGEYPSLEELGRRKHEYEILNKISATGVIQALALMKYQHSVVLVMEDFGGTALKQLLSQRSFDLQEVLSIGIQVAESIGKIHEINVIHKDINPANIVWNPQSSQVKIIDFDLATQLSRQTPSIRIPESLEGTLAYISPEQMGRINRDIDYRTDFYSLGITLYELLTGQLPFQSEVPLEIVHYHIAQQASPPHEINPEVPAVVSDIVLKLMSKTAEDRYEGAYGLKNDLESCLQSLMTEGKIITFEIGRQDIPSRFYIPQKLYGRESEKEQLLEAFERVGKGQKEMVMVSGYAGIGKTSLIKEIHQPVLQSKGFFVSGKFDPLHRNIPYSSIIYAFMDHILNLLTEKEEQIKEWKKKLQDVLGSIGQVLVEVIPEMELIIGKQPEVPELPPLEAQKRFNQIFQQFLRVFAQADHPLVLFLDDLQWADSASLQLLKQFMVDPETQFLLIIGAYRDNEVSASHPLTLTLNDIKEATSGVSQLHLPALTNTQVNQLCTDTLHCNRSVSKPLAELVFEKTQGNPFFVNQFLQSLYEDKLLVHEASTGRWRWDLAEIEKKGITSNVVELMVNKIEKLRPETQNTIKLASCIGNKFTLRMLSTLNGKPEFETAEDLWEALKEGLIQPLGTEYRLLQGIEIDKEISAETDANTQARKNKEQNRLMDKIAYLFTHDRIQQAANSILSEEEKNNVHLKIGRMLLKQIPKEEQEEAIFDIVNQLNFGASLIKDPEEQLQLAKLNLIAGKKANASAANEQAFNYLSTGIALLGDESWQNQYDLQLELHNEAVKAAYVNTDFDEMDRFAETTITNARELLDKVKAYEIKILAFQSKNKMVEATRLALQTLRQLGVKLPENPNYLQVGIGLQKTMLGLIGKKQDDFLKLPAMADPLKLAAMRLLLSTTASIYFINPNLLTLVVFQFIILSLKYGRAPETDYGVAGYGMIMTTFGFVEAGVEYAQVAAGLAERASSKKHWGRTHLLIDAFITHRVQHLKEAQPSHLKAYQYGLESRDTDYAAMAALFYCQNSFFLGRPLAEVDEGMAAYGEIMRKFKEQTYTNLLDVRQQTVQNFLGRNSDPCQLVGDVYNETEMIPLHMEANDKAAMFSVHYYKLMLCLYFEQFSEAVKLADVVAKTKSVSMGLIHIPMSYFHDSLSRAGLLNEIPRSKRNYHLRKIRKNQKALKTQADQAPMNHLHRFHLVEAERARVEEQTAEAMEFYARAIDGARKYEYLHEEALANELAGKFYLNMGLEKIARVYLQEARYLYNKWGAKAKISDMETKYPQLQFPLDSPDTAILDRKISISAGSTSQLLDFSSVQKASRAIVGEFILDKILKTLMRLVMENAGAEKVLLILKEGDQFIVEAEAAVDSKAKTDMALPLDECTDLSTSIVRYVLRTETDMVISDSKKESSFARDPYIVKNRPKSVLCIPVKYHGNLTGVLYMENNQVSGAFTQDRIEVLQVLTSQAAISIENAKLYSDLEQRVKDRTADLNESLKEVESANRKVTDSINYARRIQNSMLPAPELLKGHFSDSFVLWRPRDIVGGDFYYIDFVEGNILIAVVDCTGHGVPGAFMSIISLMGLRRIIVEEGVHQPSEILKRMNATIKTLLHKETEYTQSNDGLDASICLVKLNEGVLDYSGTKMSMLYIQDNQPIFIKGDNHSIGDKRSDLTFEFTSHSIPLNSGNAFYLFTDGFTDQTGGDNNMMFGKKRFQKLLWDNHQRPFDEQRQILIDTLKNYRGDQDRKDDVTVIGFKI